MSRLVKAYPYLWSHFRRFRIPFLGIGLVLFLQMLFTILAPIPIRYILDDVIKGSASTEHHASLYGWNLGIYSGAEALLILSFLAFAVGATLVYLYWVEQIWLGKVAFRLNERLRRELFGQIFTRRQSYLDSRKKVDILGRLSGDVSNLETVVGNGVPAIVRDVPMVFVLLGVMFFLNTQLTLALTLCLPFLYLIGQYCTNKMRVSSRHLRRRTVVFEEETYEAVNSMAIVKSLRGEQKLYQKLLGRVIELTSASRDNLKATQALETAMGLTQFLVKGGFIFLGTWAIFRGETGLGEIFQLFAYSDTLARHVNNINKFIAKYPKCAASMERIEELHRDMQLEPEVSGEERLSRAEVASSPHPILFRDVTFRHGDHRPIFRNFSLAFPRNRLIAVVGQSGVGKSTFSRLLNRLVDPQEGRLEIHGRDIRAYNLHDLRALVRVISQETFLISGSVRENLQLAVDRAVPDAELEAALEAVNALGFVSALPKGIDTEIGEGGLQLSGGQAKRIHLARAFLDLESEILLLDEPTTGLDTLSAQLVMDSIRSLSASKSLVFWVTHRMQEVFIADQVLFFHSGRDPIFSAHEQLFRESASYRALMEEKDSATIPDAEKNSAVVDKTAIPSGERYTISSYEEAENVERP